MSVSLILDTILVSGEFLLYPHMNSTATLMVSANHEKHYSKLGEKYGGFQSGFASIRDYCNNVQSYNSYKKILVDDLSAFKWTNLEVMTWLQILMGRDIEIVLLLHGDVNDFESESLRKQLEVLSRVIRVAPLAAGWTDGTL